MRKYIIAVIALMGLLMIGSAFATEDSAAVVQATHLQLNIDEALTVGANVIAKIEANAATNNNTVSTAKLTEILDKLLTVRNSIDVNSSNITQVQDARKNAMELVKSFKDTAKDLLGEDAKKEVRAKAEKEFAAKFGQKMKMGEEMQKKFNIKSLENFAERQQHTALNLSDDENVSLTPEFAAKIAGIRAQIEANKVSRDQIAEMRTQIKASAEGLKSERSSLVANIREEALQHRAEVLERIIAYAQEKNVSTTELVNAHAQLVVLLDTYEADNISAEEFAKQANDLHQSTVAMLNSAALAEIHTEVRAETKDDRLELREETKANMEAWREERKQIVEDLREGSKLRIEMREELKNGRSEIRAEIRSANGSRLEIRERIKNGVVETRIKERSADTGNDSEDESNDANEIEDESEDKNKVEDDN